MMRASSFCFATLLFSLLQSCTEAGVTLTPNYVGDACPNTNVTLTCITTGTGILAWATDVDNQVFTAQSSPLNQDILLNPNFIVRVTVTTANSITSTATINATTNGTGIACSDNTSGGSSDEETILLAIDPSTPLNLVNTTTTYNSVSLSWSQPSSLGGVAINYTISVVPEPQGGCPSGQCRRIGASSTNTTITNLQYGREYEITVTAVNCAGKSPTASLTVNIVAEEPSPPTNLLTCMFGQEMRLSWDRPSSISILSPPISNYIATLTTPGLQTIIRTLLPNDCNCSYSLTLQVNTASLYTVTLASNNSIGISTGNPMANIYTSPNITSQLVLVATTTAVFALNVSWSACSGSLADLVVNYTLNGQSNVQIFPVTLPLGTSYIPLASLQADATYSLSVEVMSSGGVSVGSLTGASFATEQEIQPNECSSVVLTITETAMVTVSSTTGVQPGQQQCTNDGTLLLSIGALGAVAAISITCILALLLCLLCCLKKRNKARTGEGLHTMNDYPSNDYPLNNDGRSSSVANSNVHLLSASPSPGLGLELTMNNSYGQISPHFLPNECDMYAEVAPKLPNRPIVTENPTYIQTSSESRTEPLYIEDEKMEESIKSLSPPSSPCRSADVSNPAYNKTGSVYLDMSRRYEDQPVES